MRLFTFDVKALYLYPSIRPVVAVIALKDAFEMDRKTSEITKIALMEMTQLLFKYSYVMSKGKCYISTEGIPTGGCNSRQTADCTLHWLVEEVKGDIPSWDLIQLFKRFIDDIFGIWRVTRDEFDEF